MRRKIEQIQEQDRKELSRLQDEIAGFYSALRNIPDSVRKTRLVQQLKGVEGRARKLEEDLNKGKKPAKMHR